MVVNTSPALKKFEKNVSHLGGGCKNNGLLAVLEIKPNAMLYQILIM